MVLDAAALARDMDELARYTWDRVFDAPRRGIPFNEEALTSHNLHELQRNHADLHIRSFTHAQEFLIGSDWEWWIGSDDSGWIGMRIQAKKLTGDRYREVWHRARTATESQCQTLIRTTLRDGGERALLPFYCFYNGWDRSEGWPPGVPWTVGCPQPAECLTVPDVRIFGCGLAPARAVANEFEKTSATGLLPEHYGRFLPLQRPWSWLFDRGPSGIPAAYGVSLDEVVQTLAEWVPDQDERLSSRYENLPIYAEAARRPFLLDDVNPRNVPVSQVLVTDLVTGPE